MSTSAMKQESGFSLVELSLVLVIVGILLSGFVAGATRFIQQNRVTKAEADLSIIKDALIGYAITNGRLPCPDTDGDGREDDPFNCDDEHGFLPTVELGIQMQDPWGGSYRYSVDENFAGALIGDSAFDLDDLASFEVRDRSGGSLIANNIPIIIFSLGENQHDTLAAASNDEDENIDGDIVFVNKRPDPAFDDIVSWISPGVIKSRMVAAGRDLQPIAP